VPRGAVEEPEARLLEKGEREEQPERRAQDGPRKDRPGQRAETAERPLEQVAEDEGLRLPEVHAERRRREERREARRGAVRPPRPRDEIAQQKERSADRRRGKVGQERILRAERPVDPRDVALQSEERHGPRRACEDAGQTGPWTLRRRHVQPQMGAGEEERKKPEGRIPALQDERILEVVEDGKAEERQRGQRGAEQRSPGHRRHARGEQRYEGIHAGVGGEIPVGPARHREGDAAPVPGVERDARDMRRDERRQQADGPYVGVQAKEASRAERARPGEQVAGHEREEIHGDVAQRAQQLRLVRSDDAPPRHGLDAPRLDHVHEADQRDGDDAGHVHAGQARGAALRRRGRRSSGGPQGRGIGVRHRAGRFSDGRER